MSVPERGAATLPKARPLTGTAITGLGTAQPDRLVGNEEVAAAAGVDEAWIIKRTGIRSRRHAAPGDCLHDLAARAARAALDDAEVRAVDLDLVLVATCSSDEIVPHTAPLLAAALGADGVGAVDVGAACTGFIGALTLGSAMIEAGRARDVLVVGAEMLARHADPADRGTGPIFADGAGAVVLGAR